MMAASGATPATFAGGRPMRADYVIGQETEIEGIDVTVPSALDRCSLETELRARAGKGGLEMVDLRLSGDGLLGHRTCAVRSTAGETIDEVRILGLLRALSGTIQWVAARKERRLERPEELRSILGERAA